MQRRFIGGGVLDIVRRNIHHLIPELERLRGCGDLLDPVLLMVNLPPLALPAHLPLQADGPWDSPAVTCNCFVT